VAVSLAAQTAAPERGQLDANPTVFAVLAAINAAGYDADVDSPNNNPLRAEIRRELAARNIPSLADLRYFYRQHKQGSATADLSQYISFALSVSDPPDFSLKGRSADIPPDVQPLEGLDRLLDRFYQEANIDDLWKRAQPAFDGAIERYHEPVSNAVLQVNGFL
jgi:hypothetical protein